MEPLRKALRLPRVNLFIADDTGLGKTIEASLIARELLLRKKAKAIVVAAPPSAVEQWKAELEEPAFRPGRERRGPGQDAVSGGLGFATLHQNSGRPRSAEASSDRS